MELITQDQAKEILLKKVTDDVELLRVVRRYIYDVKKVDVGVIQRVTTPIHAHLLDMAINSCLKYYFNL